MTRDLGFVDSIPVIFGCRTNLRKKLDRNSNPNEIEPLLKRIVTADIRNYGITASKVFTI